MKERHLLAADIGGTNSRFAMFRLEEVSGGLELSMVPGSRVRLSTAAFASFGDLLEALRKTVAPCGFTLLPGTAAARESRGFNLVALSLAVPGAVEGAEQDGGTCRAPNIKWPLSAAEARRASGVGASLLNDFAAQGLACLFPEILGPREVLPGSRNPTSPSVIIGAGTGLGKAIILPDPVSVKEPQKTYPPEPAQKIFITRRAAASGRDGMDNHSDLSGQNFCLRLDARVLPSEGGHAAFPFNGRAEADFQAFMLEVTGRREAIGDMVVTGHGLAALFAYHSGLREFPPPPEVTPRLGEQPLALEWMARFYGRACRNLVLETLALDGVFLSGGMLSHVPGLLGHRAFAEEFRASETQGPLLAKVPVWWVSNQDSGLWGAALHGVNLL